MGRASILVVDDDPASASYMALALRREQHAVRTASGAAEALACMSEELPAVVITDLQMPDLDGLELLSRIKERWPQISVVLVTVEQDVPTVVLAIQRGAVNYLIKPASPVVLREAVRKALGRTMRGRETVPDNALSGIVGQSPAIARVRHLITLASKSDVNVVVTGETGTGKELAARAVHELSGLGRGPFVPHNCAVTSAELFDSEFFGHRRGAFTGADRERSGLLREADGGTLFLDELECLSLANQAKLLRVLDDGAVRPVGGEQSRPVSVRFVAATNRAPPHMIAKGELREDLYYRLRGFEIALPPLRERSEDIAILAEYFLRASGKALESEALAALQRSSWPGNIRQLRTVLRRAASVATGNLVTEEHLDLNATSDPPRSSDPPPPSSTARDGTLSLHGMEREAIGQALALYCGNLSQAARALGIHRSTLRRKLREFGMS